MEVYDIDALKEDLPTAKELAQFVYDKTQIALDLVGKPKAEQYLAAKNALEGKKIPADFLTDENPYVDKKDIIPVDEKKPFPPPRSEKLPDVESEIHHFNATNMPHPLDPQSDRKVQIMFRKYDNGMITYQIMGPTEMVAVGERINKFGQTVPEKYTWLDPRTEELVCRNADGSFTEKGRGLYTYCIGEKGANIWPLIDKNIVSVSAKNIADPWA
jgi:hypothetical protein